MKPSKFITANDTRESFIRLSSIDFIGDLESRGGDGCDLFLVVAGVSLSLRYINKHDGEADRGLLIHKALNETR